MLCLGEMATWLPVPGAIPQYCSRYIDNAVGFAVGWNVRLRTPDIEQNMGRKIANFGQNWYFCSIVLCLDISAAAIVINFWEGARTISV